MFRYSTTLSNTFKHVNAGRYLSTCTKLAASPQADRTLAMPIVFLSVQGWDNGGLDAWQSWARLMANQGYESLHVSLDPLTKSTQSRSTTEQVIEGLESDLIKQLSSAGGSPFPPILFASSASCLVAETYVSSHPLSGLFLHQPASPLKLSQSSLSLPTIPVSDFTYEPNFPLAVTASSSLELEQSDHRLWQEYGKGWDMDDRIVDFLIVKERDEQGFRAVTEWMDDAGL